MSVVERMIDERLAAGIPTSCLDDCAPTLNGDQVLICCDLPIRHSGPHWSQMFNLTWKVGKPDE